MQAQLRDWFRYNQAANDKIIQILNGSDFASGQALDLFSHMLNAHNLWLDQIQFLEVKTRDSRQPIDKNDFYNINEKVHGNTQVCLQSENFGMHFNKPIHYVNSKGEASINTISEIYFYILSYSAYHRGQIALMIQEAGLEPPVSDYIIHKQEQQLAIH